MAKQKQVRATLRQNLRDQGALKPTYEQRIDVFCKWAKENGLKRATLDEVREHIQDYIDYRRECGLSESTLHTDLAALCRATNTSMTDFETIYRGQPTKGRSNDSMRVRTAANERVVAFAECVGIRKDEYSKLRNNDYIEKDGKGYVIVRSGKGGKYQEQLIADKDREFVSSYFSGSDEYLFSKDEIKACQHSNLHEIRREHAQEMYNYYERTLNTPEERERAKDMLEKRFNENPKKRGKFERSRMDIPYITRGRVREELYNADAKLEYDRLALMMVSVFHLSHYREDVAVKNYMK